MILGIDLGNYSVKTSERISFCSKVTEQEQFDDTNRMDINGEVLYVGDGKFDTGWNKAEKDNTLTLLYTAISRSTEDRINRVVLGLPIKQYKKNKDKLKEYIKENRCARVNERDIVIQDVEVVPESAAIYYNLPYEHYEEFVKNQLTIVCIGGRTTEICQYKNGKIIGFDSYKLGMLNVYQDIVSYINNKYTKDFELEEGEDVLENGLLLDGEYIDMSFIKPILKRHFIDVYKDIQLKFNIDKGYIYLSGGGSKIFEKAFRNRSSNVVKSNDPIYDNVMGYKRVGANLWQ